MFSTVRKQIGLTIILSLISISSFAGNDPGYSQTLFGKNGQLQASNQLYTFDINYQVYKNTSGAVEKTWYVKNAVRFMIDEESPWFISSDFTASIVLNITTENAAGTITNLPQKTLTIDYKIGEGLVSGSISSFEFRDAVKVTVTIASAVSKNVNWDVTKNLKLVNEIISLRDWGFNCSNSTITGIVTDSLFADEWKVKWNVPDNFQTEYDVEWAWIDESAVGNYTYGNSVNLDSVFDNNSTRITTSNNYYRIPLLYEDNGRVYARVRMAQIKVNGQRVEGNWYYLNDGGLAYLQRTEGQGHEDNLNWQATTTFAEEGKRKTVIQYFDGSLRGRQIVTKDNVNRTTVVAETFYDYQGRPVIQVLPAPTLNTIIEFTKNFNQFDDSRNAKTVYDKLDINQSSCNKLTAKMLNTATGSASQYYSANNPRVNDGLNKYIPDAGSYPYTETRYTNDGTGRIDAQGGVGPLFQINSGRETKYYYESADQDDLDALFGTDAGYASHYSKNWVRDANGQYSISYVDMTGKTVATALAGDTPDNLQALPSYSTASNTITRQLIDNETNNVHGNSIISSKSLMVAKPGNYEFNYNLSPEKLKMMLCTGNQFCFDCLYELNISIIPDCSDKVIANFTNPVVVKNFNLGEYLTSCTGNNSPLLQTNFNVWLEEGSYTVVKELKMSTAARDWYRENVFITNDTCKKKIDFINEQLMLAIQQQNCYTTCAECNSRLGSFSDFISRFKTATGYTDPQVQPLLPQLQASYNVALANCQQLCDNPAIGNLDELMAIKETMLQDMTPPYGQYAQLENINKPYNIFSPNPLVTLCTPVFPFKSPVDYIPVASPGQSTVACGAGFKNYAGVMTLSAGHGLSNEDFTVRFEDSYANSLLYYHPEFSKLRFAEEKLQPTYLFGSKMQTTDTWQDAISRGFITYSTLSNPVAAANWLLNHDPFFAQANMPAAQYRDRMFNAINSQYTSGPAACSSSQSMGMWKLAKLMVFCNKELRNEPRQIADGNGCLPPPSTAYTQCYYSITEGPPSDYPNHCPADLDRVWKNFSSLYLSFRSVLVSQWLSANTTVNTSIFNRNTGYNYQERFLRYLTSPPYTIINLDDLGGLLGNQNPNTFETIRVQEADSICRANSGNWMIRLRRCPQVETLAQTQSSQWIADSTWLSNYLVSVCKQGVDYMGHPFGAASLPDEKASIQLMTNPDGSPLSGVYVRNFPDIIRYYLLYRFGQGSINQFCYPELIDYPNAYNVAPPAFSPPIITAPEACVCERINYFKTKWQNAGSPGTFSSYLLNTQGTSISQDTLNILIQMCTTGYASTNPNCNFLAAPIRIPAIFQCRGTANLDSSKTCITCADYAELKQQFLTERGVPAPYTNPQTETETAWNRAFADFANYRTGFSKLWPEYVQFGITCANDSTFSCTNLTSLVTAWQATNPPQSGDSCRISFTQYMNSHTGRNLTFNQWMDEFLKACGTKPPVCQAVLTCSRFGSLINSYYLHYGFQIWRNSNCQQLFTNFVNDSLGTSYSYQEINENYTYLCGTDCPLDLCSFPNSHLLSILYNYYKNFVYQNWWSYNQCQEYFVNWFNAQLGFTSSPYDWNGIVELYHTYWSDKKRCVPDINQLCAPPYSCGQFRNILQLYYAQYPGADTLINCQTLLTAFFNQQLGTNYTFYEIKELFQAICGTDLPSCQGGIIWDCKEMILLTQDLTCSGDRCVCFTILFNSHYGTNYTYEEIRQLYLDHCDFVLNICPLDPPVFTCEVLQNALGNFNRVYPGGGAALGADCQQFFAAYFNNRFSSAYSYEYINNLYLVQCGDSLHVCESKCSEYISFVTNYINQYGSIKIPLQARQQLFAMLFNNTFGYTGKDEGGSSAGSTGSTSGGGSGNQPLVYSQIKTLLNGCLTMPPSLETENLYLTLNDANVLRDLKTAYYLLHPDGVPVNCETDFTAWINWMMQEDRTFCDLVGLYNSILGSGSGDICSPSNGCVEIVEGGGGISLEGGSSNPPESYPPMLCGLNVEIFQPPLVDTSNCKDPWMVALNDATIKWELYLDSLRRNFDTAYFNKCTRAKYLESFTVTFARAEHHYTLYYYDQAGQLVRTVPPEGVDDKRADGTFLASVKTARNTNAANPVRPSHTMATDYRYNTLGQVVQQKSPDGGLSKFWYDKLGRLVVSQNAQQAIDGKFSYTIYDELGRIQEVGQKPQTTVMTQTTSRSESSLNSWLNSSNNKEQITRTVYDIAYGSTEFAYLITQRNLRNRVSYSQVWKQSWDTYAASATYYTYDIHGNVDTLLQDYGNSNGYGNIMNYPPGNRWKRIVYDYDLISGKVNLVSYQPGYINPNGQWYNNPDRFYHRYSYDAENKLTMVETSHDSLIWERDATYSYYKHGPLARTELGQQQVQGTDYAYTLQGWLKGVNSTAPTNSSETGGQGIFDIGEDGKIGSVHSLVARDAYGFSLNYYSTVVNSVTINDYKSINNTVTAFAGSMFNLANTDAATIAKPLFNGNIASMMVNIPKLGDQSGGGPSAQLYGYAYDQLNRIMSMDAFGGFNNTNNTWTNGTPTSSSNYKERVTYDANGNIKTYVRNGTTQGGTPLAMDNLTYGYNITSGKLVNNKLRHVKDAIGDGNYAEDIDNQPDDNYDYDAIGNLIKDTKEGITNITWSVYGKILSIAKSGNTISYTYDASGNRISKTANGKTTWYVRDASGNVMSVYEQRSDLNSGHLTQTEVHLYGSSRLGIFNINRDMVNPPEGEITNFERGRKFFELSNHLGNVLVTVSDRKIQVQDPANTTQILYYTADVVTATDYYPFGMITPGRKFEQANSAYRYGFNGKEKDKDMSSLTAYDYGFRIYNPAIGRFLSVDPLARSYPMLTSYQFASNTPIEAIDLDGLEAVITKKWTDSYGKTHLDVFKASDHKYEEWKTIKSGMFWSFNKEEAQGITWVSGFKDYNYTNKSFGNVQGYNGPEAGTLNIDETSRNNVKVSFVAPKIGDDPQKGPKPATLGQSISMGWKGFKTFFLKPDPLVDRSVEAHNTINNFFTAATIPFSAPEAFACKVLPILSTASSLDDVLGGEKGSLTSQYLSGNNLVIANVIKLGVTLTGRTSDVIALGEDLKDGYKTVKNTGLVLKDTYDATTGTVETANSIKKPKEDKKKEN